MIGPIDAANYLASLGLKETMLAQEALASCAIEGNQLAGRCSKTMDRIFRGEKVSNDDAIELVQLLKKMQDDEETQAGTETQSGS